MGAEAAAWTTSVMKLQWMLYMGHVYEGTAVKTEKLW